VDKPPGLSVHNNEDPENLLGVLKTQLSVDKLYPVHRLDRETSGVQVLSLNNLSAKMLSEEFLKRRVRKTYGGICRGPIKKIEGCWNKKLTDKAEGRKNPQGLKNARVTCETLYHVVDSNKYFSFCEFDLITGRQHQIRKHTAIAGHSLVGDPRYGDKKYNQKMADIYKTQRMFLHCKRIEILGNIFESTIPEDFALLFKD